MRSAKSTNSLANPQQQANNNLHHLEAGQQQQQQAASNSGPTSPICRCRVMYLGSSVPHITKDGLQGIQEPLRELYPDKVSLASGNAGIDSWLSVWSNGILIENVDETGREVKRFFKIDALHYCAAVKFVPSPPNQSLQHQQLNNPYTTLPNGNQAALPKFLPLDSPHTRQSNSNPPIFASIIRRTTGIKVLECHAFICKREAAANALVRCCFHAYADTMYAKQIGADVNSISTANNTNSRTLGPHPNTKQYDMVGNDGGMVKRRSKSIAALNDTIDPYIQQRMNAQNETNHQMMDRQSMSRRPSMNEQQQQHYMMNCDNNNENGQQQQLYINGNGDQLRKQQKLSKSMHHLNQNGQQNMGTTYQQLMMDQTHDYDGFMSNQSTSASCINAPSSRWLPSKHKQDFRFMQQPNQQPPFYNPQASRVPSYPPQNLMDAANNGGTLRSIRSMAANSIASTLLRSKKHAKAMSMAQLNQDKITSFHQPHNSNAATMGGPIMLPPVPPMFLPNLPARSIINGSQTMKPLSKSMMPLVGPPMNYEAMTPKEMKKLLKKSAKYGIDPNKFGENGLPLIPFRAPPLPPPPPPHCQMPPLSKSGTMVSQSMFMDMYGNDMPDMAHPSGMPTPRGPPMPDTLDPQALMKPILVKPNPEFLKSKAGKKWLKQQKEFKKLLPPHLDGLPIIFGPPPVDALEPAGLPNTNIQAPTFIPPPHPGLPMMDSSGYYNPHPFYGQNGRASAASTLLRYSPNSQIMQDHNSGTMGPLHPHDTDYLHSKSHNIYNNNNNNNMPPYHLIHKGDNSSLVFANNECGLDLHHHQRHFLDNGRNQKRHMVEQSVISLGDENDYDDEEDEEQQNGYYSSASIHHGQEISSSGGSRRTKSAQLGGGGTKLSNRDIRSSEHAADNYQDKGVYNQHNQQQGYSDQNNDDQSSYSSGIYKRGHINERAFSYSIRQEHKSGGNNPEYATRDETLAENDRLDQQQQQCHMSQHDNQQQHSNGNMFQGERDQDDEYYHHRDGNVSQTLPVNELTARLESQLNMKSFANSRIKSQM